MLELVFTSAKTGLIPGRSGFCSVAWTEGMPQNLVSLLENMSGYNVLYPPSDPRSKENPVVCAYQKIQYGQSMLRILSRIAFAGLDHTGRTNKIAHHIILENDAEWIALQHGPVSAFLCEENFYTSWNEPPRLLPRRRYLRSAMTDGLKAEKWQEFSGSAQWAGVIADRFAGRNEKSCLYLEYDLGSHGKNILHLIDEITRLMPASQAREFTFNTYFSAAQNNSDCFFRAALPNCAALPAIKRFRANELISLTERTPLPENISGSIAVNTALTGNPPARERKPVISQEQMHQLKRNSASGEKARPDDRLLPNKGNAIRSIDQPFLMERAAVPEVSASRRILIFSVTALLFLVITGVAILLCCWPDEIPVQGSDDHATQKSDFSLSEGIPDLPPEADDVGVKNKDNVVPAADKKVEKTAPAKKNGIPVREVKSKAAKKTVPAPKKEKPVPSQKTSSPAPAPAKTEKPAASPAIKITDGKLTAAEKYSLTLDFRRVNKRGIHRIKLPGNLKKCSRISVVMKKKWQRNMGEITAPGQFVQFLRSWEIIVYPAMIGDNKNNYMPDRRSKAFLSIKVDRKNSLLVIDDSGYRDLSPGKEHIESIFFYCGNTRYIWKNTLDNEILKLIKYGRAEASGSRVKYVESAEEKIFSKAGLDINTDEMEKFFVCINTWDRSLSELRAAEKAIKKVKPFKRCSAELRKEINNMVRADDFGEAVNSFEKVCSMLLYLDDEKEFGSMLANLAEEWEAALKEAAENRDKKGFGKIFRDQAQMKYATSRAALRFFRKDRKDKKTIKSSIEFVKNVPDAWEKMFKKWKSEDKKRFQYCVRKTKKFAEDRKEFSEAVKNCNRKKKDFEKNSKKMIADLGNDLYVKGIIKEAKTVSPEIIVNKINSDISKYVVRKWK